MTIILRTVAVLVPALMAACTPPPTSTAVATADIPTQDAATRTAPVVAGRPARVFVFAGWDSNCAAVAPPLVTVLTPPAQGDISLRPGQETTIAASAVGTCAGRSVTGTGVYYTAREGAAGTDRFTIEARLPSGETSRRNFEVTIAN
ncbi:MAG: hypothetical protein MUC37_13630 [Hyphomicrobium sp.]|nr:hypothetical protein [Hyphomicrobium sp.]